MLVRQLGAYLSSEGLITDGDPASLSGLRVGIDVVYWLRSLQSLKDPFAEALGAVPPGIYGIINIELEWFRKFNVCPVFVFQGIAPGSRHTLFNVRMDSVQMDKVWNQLARGNRAEAQKYFSTATSRINSDIVYFVFHHLRHMGCEVVQAPYLAGAQLAHFREHNIVDLVWGPPGLMMFKVQRVLLALDGQRGSFEYVDLANVMNKLQIDQSQFVDICMAAGTEYCETYPFLNIDPDMTPRFDFSSAVQIIRCGPLVSWLQRLPYEDMKMKHTRDYAICKVLVQSCPVFSVVDNAVKPLGSCSSNGNGQHQAPSDFCTMIGERLPNSLYCLMLQGIMWHKLPAALCSGFWRDSWQPLVDTKEMRELVADLQEYRQLSLGLIGVHLPVSLTRKEINCKAYWETSAERSQGFQQAPANDSSKILISDHIKKGLKWVIHIDMLRQEMARQNSDKVDLKFCLEWHAHECETKGSLFKELRAEGETSFSNHKDALAATVHFKLLEHLDLIADDGMMTVLGNVLKETPRHLQEPCLVALELMKFGVLNGDAFEVAPFGDPFPVEVNYPIAPLDSKTKSRLLLTRVFSLVPMRLKNTRWDSDVVFDLCIFQSLVRVLTRSLRQLTEAALCSLLLGDLERAKCLPPGFMCATPDQQDHMATPALFPVFMLSRACMGIVFQHFLNYTGDPVNFQRDLQSRFPCCERAVMDLKDAMVFWEEIMRCVNEIAVPLQAQDLQADMKAASDMLHRRQQQLQIFPDSSNLRGDEHRQVEGAVLRSHISYGTG